MSRIAYVSDEPIRISQLIDMSTVRRGIAVSLGAFRRTARTIGKFVTMWYL